MNEYVYEYAFDEIIEAHCISSPAESMLSGIHTYDQVQAKGIWRKSASCYIVEGSHVSSEQIPLSRQDVRASCRCPQISTKHAGFVSFIVLIVIGAILAEPGTSTISLHDNLGSYPLAARNSQRWLGTKAALKACWWGGFQCPTDDLWIVFTDFCSQTYKQHLREQAFFE